VRLHERAQARLARRLEALDTEAVLLPEIDGSLRFIEERLDALDQEEAVRVRDAARARGHESSPVRST
jgi:vacuolar-type H+-ATPase subunit D/Vma8